MSSPHQFHFSLSFVPGQFFLPDYPDLERAWQSLPGGPTALHPRSGEVWQYMGTWYSQDRNTHKWRWVHQFRHRVYPDYPYKNERRDLHIPVGEWTRVYLDFQLWIALALSNASCAWRLISASLRRSASAWAASSSIIRKHIRRMCG
ncbi:MAG: hypothetical protein KJ077_46315 [Anaerolineae bacterium]|nr:hypothetical protein [Anaerolineae bacterium]